LTGTAPAPLMSWVCRLRRECGTRPPRAHHRHTGAGQRLNRDRRRAPDRRRGAHGARLMRDARAPQMDRTQEARARRRGFTVGSSARPSTVIGDHSDKTISAVPCALRVLPCPPVPRPPSLLRSRPLVRIQLGAPHYSAVCGSSPVRLRGLGGTERVHVAAADALSRLAHRLLCGSCGASSSSSITCPYVRSVSPAPWPSWRATTCLLAVA
jgi:hypothetical protein